MTKKDPRKGDIIQIDWLDIQEDPVGNTDKAKVARRTSYAVFWEIKDDQGHQVLVTTSTIDPQADQSGWCAYPIGCVVGIKVIKRGRKSGKGLDRSSGKHADRNRADLRSSGVSSPGGKNDDQLCSDNRVAG